MRNTNRRRDRQWEALEARVLFSAAAIATAVSSAIESFNGVSNNIANPTWGASNTDLLRLTSAAYGDGISTPAGANLLSARTISNLVNSQADPSNPGEDYNTLDQNNLSDYGYAFGQFIDHDLDLTPDGGASMPIAVSATDPIGPQALAFTRSQTDPTTGTSTSNPLQQVNVNTSYLDLSQIYGSSQAVDDALRTHKGGLLKTSPGNLLPYDNTTYFTTAQIATLNMANDAQAVPESELFAAGDVRANENLELTALETLFVRNHNLIAGQLAKQNPGWTDEHVFQAARKLNIAEYQSIIYNEYLPALLGTNAIKGYTGYKSNVDAAISTEFSTVAFRMGHSMVSPTIARDGNNGQAVQNYVELAYDFFDPNLISSTGSVDPLTGLPSTDIGNVLKGESDGNGQAMDAMAVNDIRNLLFGNAGDGGDDLIARDIQRGRDDGIPTYNAMRKQLGLAPVTSFAQITSNVTVQKELAAAYPGGVNTIDAFEGGIAEDHVAGSDLGPLFQAILVNQFTRLRDGDRFFYQNEFSGSQLQAIQSATLTQVIEANTNITNLQSDAFIFKIGVSGQVGSGLLLPGLLKGVANQEVDLVDASSGQVALTTKTDANGNYKFTNLDGMYLGSFRVQTTLSQGGSTHTYTSQVINFTRGDQQATQVNLGPVLCLPQMPPTQPGGFISQLFTSLSSLFGLNSNGSLF